MRAFGEECYNTKRLDTHIPFYYVRALLNASEEECGRWQDVFFEDGVLEKSRAILTAGLKAEGRTQRSRDLDSCLLALISWAAGDVDAAVELNKVRQGRFCEAAMKLVGSASYYSITRALDVLGRNPPEELTELTRRCLKREFDGTLELMLKMRDRGAINKDNVPLIIPLSFAVNLNVEYEKGHWTDLQTSGQFDGWVNHGRIFKAKKWVYVAGTREASLSLSVPVPENMELGCRVVFEEGDDDASFSIVLDDTSLTRRGAPVIRLERKAGQVTADIEDVAEDQRPVAWRDDQEPVAVTVVSRDSRLTLAVDGKTVFEELDATEAFRPSNRDKTRGLKIKGLRCSFSELKVRKPQRRGFAQ
jgi:hypothetical protein